MDLCAFLQGISPWWWVAFGVALGALEMATMSFFLIWPALAAIALALWLVISPNLSGEVQIAAFAILSIILTFIGRMLLNRFGDGGPGDDTLNSRAALMVGRHGKVLKFTGPEGHISIDGVRWRAHWAEGMSSSEGDTVIVTGAEGMRLIVGKPD